MKVMLFCPTYRIEPETLDSIFRLDVGAHDVHIVFTRGNHRTKDGKVNTLLAYQEGRKLFLHGDYDAMLTVESDMIIPPDTLHRLIALDADIALGLYIHRHGFPWFNAQRYREDEPHKQGLFYRIDEASEVYGQSLRVSAGGLGCALVRRAVIEAHPFRLDWVASANKKAIFIPADCDTYFMLDALRADRSIRCDGAVVCGHKKPDGEVLWPTPDGMTTEALTPSPYPTF